LGVRRFNAPPEWPAPPDEEWKPPRGWTPPESWPPAPPGWAFWTNEHGRRVPGPIGRYGVEGRGWQLMGIGALAGLALLAGFQVFGGGDQAQPESLPPPRVVRTQPSDEVSQLPSDSATPSPANGLPTPTSGPTTDTTTPDPTQSETITPTPTSPTPVLPSTASTPKTVQSRAATPVFYKNCGAVRAAGKAPLRRGDPGYSLTLDRDGDGIACDK